MVLQPDIRTVTRSSRDSKSASEEPLTSSEKLKYSTAFLLFTLILLVSQLQEKGILSGADALPQTAAIPELLAELDEIYYAIEVKAFETAPDGTTSVVYEIPGVKDPTGVMYRDANLLSNLAQNAVDRNAEIEAKRAAAIDELLGPVGDLMGRLHLTFEQTSKMQ